MRLTGVILAAGEGRRLGALGEARSKACLPLLGRPLLHHHLDLLVSMGADDAVIVVGHLPDQVREAASSFSGGPLAISYAEQRERRGIAQALTCARAGVPEGMVVILGDTYFWRGDLADPVARLRTGDVDAVLSIRQEPDPERIRRECTVRYTPEGRLLEIREKPPEPFNDLKPCGMYFFAPAIWQAIERTPPSALRGEVEITDSIQTLVDMGCRVGRADSVRWDTNMNVPSDVLRTNLVELRRRGLNRWLDPTAQLGDGCLVERAVIGAGATVGAGCQLSRVVVLGGTDIPAGTHAEDAVLGPGYRLEAPLPADEAEFQP